jgi:hypothetical protein
MRSLSVIVDVSAAVAFPRPRPIDASSLVTPLPGSPHLQAGGHGAMLLPCDDLRPPPPAAVAVG